MQLEVASFRKQGFNKKNFFCWIKESRKTWRENWRFNLQKKRNSNFFFININFIFSVHSSNATLNNEILKTNTYLSKGSDSEIYIGFIFKKISFRFVRFLSDFGIKNSNFDFFFEIFLNDEIEKNSSSDKRKLSKNLKLKSLFK